MSQNPAVPAPVIDAASVDAAITTRLSARAFLPQPVPRETIEHLLQVASRAPSGTNTQPWKVYVLQGASRDSLVDKCCAAHDALAADPSMAAQYRDAYDYYPPRWASPFIERRRENGWGLYGLLGIGKGDKDKMHAQHQRNFRFFDAPVGLIFTVDAGTGQGALLDFGMFLQNVMVAARARGLDTCPQAAFTQFHRVISDVLQIPASEQVVCGMALGFADHERIENSLETERAPVSEFARFLD